LAELFGVEFANGLRAMAIHVDRETDLGEALRALGITPPSPTLVLTGGADDMGETEVSQLGPLFAEVVVPVVERLDGLVLDGGTDTGVMRLIGRARADRGGTFALVGVVVHDLAALRGEPSRWEAAELEPHHTHFVLVPGSGWGDEAAWLARLGSEVAHGAASVTLLVNGGEIAWADVEHSVEAGRPVIVVDGSGRTADVLAAALRGRSADDRATRLARSGLVRSVRIDDDESLARVLDTLLSERG
jgi:SLOG in TRPM, prokaryote